MYFMTVMDLTLIMDLFKIAFCEEDVILTDSFIIILCLTVPTLEKFLSLSNFVYIWKHAN